MDLSLENKVVIITGATRGIGLEIARLFYDHKALVIIFGSKKESVLKATSLLKSEGRNVEGYYPDLNDIDDISKVVLKIYEKYGHIDILINNAGMSDSKKLEDITSEDFSKIMDLNVKGIFNMCKVVVPYMKKGVILNTSSMVSIYGQSSGVGYPASKFAVNGITKSLALELAPDIRVNAVAPGIINTDMVKNLPSSMIDPLIEKIPLKRMGEARDIANAFLFLASDMASYITGVILSVDGAAKN